MVNFDKYINGRGKIVLPSRTIRNMLNYISLFGFKCEYYPDNYVINIYLNKGKLLITFHINKNYANVYYGNNYKLVVLYGWLNVLRFVSSIKNIKRVK